MSSSKKFQGFVIASVLGFLTFAIAAYLVPPEGLVSVAQFWFGYQSVNTGGFFGFRAWEQTAKAKNGG